MRHIQMSSENSLFLKLIMLTCSTIVKKIFLSFCVYPLYHYLWTLWGFACPVSVKTICMYITYHTHVSIYSHTQYTCMSVCVLSVTFELVAVIICVNASCNHTHVKTLLAAYYIQ